MVTVLISDCSKLKIRGNGGSDCEDQLVVIWNSSDQQLNVGTNGNQLVILGFRLNQWVGSYGDQ